jgi:hypothetical protein
MATIKLLPNGVSGGFPPPAGTARPGKRGEVNGWTAGAARRNLQWLWSVNVDDMDAAAGWAVTLTVGETPDSADAWRLAREAWLERCRRAGMTRFHWVTEWTAKGRPHTHAAVYGGADLPGLGGMIERMLNAWLDIASEHGWPANTRAQHIERIDGVTGWLQYVSKHASRGVTHYQHEGAPEGWERTGRLWGHGGDWPTEEPEVLDVSAPQFVIFRDSVWAWLLNDMLERGVPATVVDETRARWADPEHGNSQGLSGWIPGHVAYALYVAAKQAAPSVQDE